MERMKSEVLARSVKMLKSQEVFDGVLEKWRQSAYVYLFHQDNVNWYYQGIVEKSSSLLVQWSVEKVIEVDIASRKLLKVNGESVKGIEHAQVLDLSDDGERWEGDVLNNQPYGWGVLYDSENRMAYEGFRIGEVNVCYGRSYYSEVGVIEYEGEICERKRWGRGIQFDRNGNTVFEGEWMNNEPLNKRVVLNEENQFLHNHIEELIIENSSCNGMEWNALDLGFLSHLRLLEVGDECFENVEEVKLIGLSQLEKVVIGKNCFTKEKNHWGNDPTSHFYLKNCERLRELKIGCFSFSDYSVCEIESAPSLEVIEMGDLNEGSYNFSHAFKLELKSDCERMK